MTPKAGLKVLDAIWTAFLIAVLSPVLGVYQQPNVPFWSVLGVIVVLLAIHLSLIVANKKAETARGA